jgi:hypothetical protein
MDVQRTCLLIGVSSGAQKIIGLGFLDVQRTCLLIAVSDGAQKIIGLGFMDVQRTCLLIAVSDGAQSPQNRISFLASYEKAQESEFLKSSIEIHSHHE